MSQHCEKENSPPPPPPPPAVGKDVPKPPVVPPEGPAGAYLVELLIFNGWPFKDHWAYWVRSSSEPDIGVQLHATGDVRNGFEFQIKRNYDFHDENSERPSTRIPLQWINGKYFDQRAMMNNGVFKLDNVPACGFEASAYKVKAPGKSLNTVDETVSTYNISCLNCLLEYFTNKHFLDHFGRQEGSEGESKELSDVDCGVCRPTCPG